MEERLQPLLKLVQGRPLEADLQGAAAEGGPSVETWPMRRSVRAHQDSAGAKVACALRIAERLPRGQAPLADQLRRAAVSIPLNIAEGGGRNRESADRARFRAIARGSAMESGALLDVIRLFNVVPQEDWGQGKSLLVRVVEMLSKMC